MRFALRVDLVGSSVGRSRGRRTEDGTMSSSKTWYGVTPEIFTCVKTTSEHDHGTKYDPPDADQGTATTSIPAIGEIVLGFNRDSSGALTYTIQKKPFIVSESQIWNGINDSINGCRK
jgi:hypothetical protein